MPFRNCRWALGNGNLDILIKDDLNDIGNWIVKDALSALQPNGSPTGTEPRLDETGIHGVDRLSRVCSNNDHYRHCSSLA
jgi:hypothetical protein